MKILYHPRFAREYKKLPAKAQRLAEEQETRFRKNPFDPRLKTHKLHGPLRDFWAFAIDHRYRIIFDFVGENTIRFYSVGDHDIYE
ncbi:MAG: hypothetical protein A3B37_01460 [Candidatus Sungbacteria bacterium RIFCSPLOWO2_01_FULL_59_16]|uniref:Type II toxin-antitoxin system mRNA interferase toxin, RelE/StbE family n=1 Tax=Candidatus Sungbacteria bacterium RIFCSPLOWO2_01_FULL_59_16 TaxID=1802280 RepID=A0A1G2LC66_9BACT|nr:MAG: hypothetical protein A3B37_01460 [Candidatus Sungbacteria bacterium RIFCSPLOWO2_01_FULL_59_16]